MSGYDQAVQVSVPFVQADDLLRLVADVVKIQHTQAGLTIEIVQGIP